jgi:hypothetical protein
VSAEIIPLPVKPRSAGATKEEWLCLDVVLGLAEDLLPVVCNPAAEISDKSNLTPGHIGRVPCLYDAQRKVVGIAKWTQAKGSGAKVERWSSDPDLGACIITRRVRGLDIDVTDATLADQIHARVEELLGVKLPVRRREGVSKRLLALIVEGSIGKRRVPVGEGHVVELLADGQMFVAAGSRADGSRYYWDGGVPSDIPVVSMEQLNTVWAALVEDFGTGTAVSSRAPSEAGADRDADDPVARWLEEKGLVLGETNRGLVVTCPWEDEHTGGEEGDGSTMWMLAGGAGHGIGHFKCMHAHCDGRTRQDYLNALGYQEDIAGEFEALAPGDGAVTPEGEETLPSFEREKDGSIKAIINNVVKGVASRKAAGVVVAYDGFRDEVMWGPGGTDGWQRFTDVDYTRLQMRLEKWGFKPIAKELLRAAVDEVSRRNAFDSAIVWLQHKIPVWDGAPRIDTFLVEYWGAGDSPYTRAVAAYLWTALAGRVLEPGCKADMVPIFVGAQGCGKSTGVASLAPTEEVFAEVSLHEKEDDLSRKLKGRLVVELGELRGLHTRELEAIKAWIVRRWENWVPKYKEFATHYARRCVFFGTTNQDQFLADSTGNRRWLPVRVGRVSSFADVLPQLWAEARDRFSVEGVNFSNAEKLSGDAHDEHTISDAWEDVIREWLGTEDMLGGGKPGDRARITTLEVARDALNLDLRKNEFKGQQKRIGEILQSKFNYTRTRIRVGGDRQYVYSKNVPSVPSASLVADQQQGTEKNV